MLKEKIPYVNESDPSGEVVYDGRKTFENQTWIKKIVFQDGTATIKEDAFKGCIGLESVTLTESVAFLESSAFLGCSNLTHFYLSKNLRSIGQKNNCDFLIVVTN